MGRKPACSRDRLGDEDDDDDDDDDDEAEEETALKKRIGEPPREERAIGLADPGEARESSSNECRSWPWERLPTDRPLILAATRDTEACVSASSARTYEKTERRKNDDDDDDDDEDDEDDEDDDDDDDEGIRNSPDRYDRIFRESIRVKFTALLVDRDESKKTIVARRRRLESIPGVVAFPLTDKIGARSTRIGFYA
ncbi:hypothetical protein HZH68_013653 [Vespula germanica]|uniref:Uncharacterized protein n=1 Tax=Vespula germanica TaxID=30212 RepID=A0A834JJA6_VESGE|nr:hypothetical protein HZH68_013653 [Vespula germanica]